MAMSYAPAKLSVPPGWEELLSSFARETLREQPGNIYEFAANYFKKKYQEQAVVTTTDTNNNDAASTLASTSTAASTTAASTTATMDLPASNGHDNNYDDDDESQDGDIDYEDPAVQDAVVKIQASYRGYRYRQDSSKLASSQFDIDVNDPSAVAAATKIQAGFRGHLVRKSIEEARLIAIDEAAIAQIDLNDPKNSEAALKIQAGFRGHQTRTRLRRRGSKASVSSTTEEGKATEGDAIASVAKVDKAAEIVAPAPVPTTIDSDTELNLAATKIQAHFRGHKARRDVLTTRGMKELEALFATLDKNGDGKVSVFEWAEKVTGHASELSAFFGGDNIEAIGKKFAEVDQDHSGGLAWEEVVNVANAVCAARAAAAPSGMDELKALFAALDKDGSGTVSSKEWGSTLAKNREKLSAFFGGETLSEIGHQFVAVDTDHSGDITWDEVAVAVKKMAEGTLAVLVPADETTATTDSVAEESGDGDVGKTDAPVAANTEADVAPPSSTMAGAESTTDASTADAAVGEPAQDDVSAADETTTTMEPSTTESNSQDAEEAGGETSATTDETGEEIGAEVNAEAKTEAGVEVTPPPETAEEPSSKEASSDQPSTQDDEAVLAEIDDSTAPAESTDAVEESTPESSEEAPAAEAIVDEEEGQGSDGQVSSEAKAESAADVEVAAATNASQEADTTVPTEDDGNNEAASAATEVVAEVCADASDAANASEESAIDAPTLEEEQSPPAETETDSAETAGVEEPAVDSSA